MDAPALLLQIFKNLNLKEEASDIRTIDLQVGKQVFQRVSANMRTELWLSVLHRRGIGDKYVRLYPSMLAKVRGALSSSALTPG